MSKMASASLDLGHMQRKCAFRVIQENRNISKVPSEVSSIVCDAQIPDTVRDLSRAEQSGQRGEQRAGARPSVAAAGRRHGCWEEHCA